MTQHEFTTNKTSKPKKGNRNDALKSIPNSLYMMVAAFER